MWWGNPAVKRDEMMHRGIIVWLLLCVMVPALWLQMITEPTCTPSGAAPTGGDALRVAVVADLHLAGPGTHWFDRVRREAFLQSTFQKAYWKLKPDVLVVLGDISDAGRKSTNVQWDAVVSRFWAAIGPFAEGPVQVVVGNHDVGDHHDVGFLGRLPRFASSFPHLDATCCSLYKWNNISFISLNAMALQDDGCSFCSNVERVVESTSSALYGKQEKAHHRNRSPQEVGAGRNPLEAGNRSGPVLLLHLPLHRIDDQACASLDIPRCAPWHDLEGSCLGLIDLPPQIPSPEEPYVVGQDVLSNNSSMYLLQALKPRLVFSGHTHRWCDRVHADGTREITVPSLTWRNRDDPSFVLAIFNANLTYNIQRCMVARESTVLGIYVLWGATILTWILIAGFMAHRRLRNKYVKPE